MSSWRDQILKEFTPKVTRLTLVADPDGLLLEEGILEGIRKRGFDLIAFEDHIAFRYLYESKFRSRWDCGEQTDLVVVLRSQESSLGSLPYDLLMAGRSLSFSVGSIFPDLSGPVVTALDRGDFDALYEAQRKYTPDRLGENATKEFVLRHVFEIAPELIKQSSDLLRVLLRRHYRGQRIPSVLDERFIYLLRQNRAFDDWPLETLTSDRELFFAFLQERWPIFLDRLETKGTLGVREGTGSYGLTVGGPADLPFDHHDIRVYIDNFFTDGLLHAVPHDGASDLAKTWASAGVRTDPSADRVRRLTKLIESIRSSMPVEDAAHTEWLRFARSWAELVLLQNERTETIPKQVRKNIKDLQEVTDSRFAAWLIKRYAGLFNQSPVHPAMLHHIPRFLARKVGENRNPKVALLVVDGLSFDQWLIIREAIVSQQREFRFRENALFAWIPTITSVSRQALFAGEPPVYFPNTVQSTEKESTLWTRFWNNQGIQTVEVVYAKGLGEGGLDKAEETLSHPRVKIAGLVIDKVDKIMHGIELGTAGMHNQVRQWAQQPYLTTLLDLLLDRGFHFYLTSDHGNVEAKGCGQPQEGAVADLRGERVRVYPDATLRSMMKERFPTALEWEPVGLPATFLPLVAPSRRAFIAEGQRTVAHGGISIEEVIVPLFQIEKKST